MLQGAAVTEQCDAEKTGGYYAIWIWPRLWLALIADFSLPESGVGPRFADERRFPEVPDGKILTQHRLFFCGDHAPFMSTHLMILQPSREAGRYSQVPDGLDFFFLTHIESGVSVC